MTSDDGIASSFPRAGDHPRAPFLGYPILGELSPAVKADEAGNRDILGKMSNGGSNDSVCWCFGRKVINATSGGQFKRIGSMLLPMPRLV